MTVVRNRTCIMTVVRNRTCIMTVVRNRTFIMTVVRNKFETLINTYWPRSLLDCPGSR